MKISLFELAKITINLQTTASETAFFVCILIYSIIIEILTVQKIDGLKNNPYLCPIKVV